jgi:hypothetical protein
MSSDTLTPRLSTLPVEITEAILDFLPFSCIIELSTKSDRISSILLSNPTWRPFFFSPTRLILLQKLYYLALNIHSLMYPTPFIHGQWSNLPETMLSYRWYEVRNWARRIDPVINLLMQMESIVVDTAAKLSANKKRKVPPLVHQACKTENDNVYRLRWGSLVGGSEETIASGVDRFAEYVALLMRAQEEENREESMNLRSLAGLLRRCEEEIDKTRREDMTSWTPTCLHPLVAYLTRQAIASRPFLRPDITGLSNSHRPSLTYDKGLVLIIRVLQTHAPLNTTAITGRRLSKGAFPHDFARLHVDEEGYASKRIRNNVKYPDGTTCALQKVMGGLGLSIPIPEVQRMPANGPHAQDVPTAECRKAGYDHESDSDGHEKVESEEEKDEREAAAWLAAFLTCADYFEHTHPKVAKVVKEMTFSA